MDIKKLIEIAQRHELNIIETDEGLLANSYKQPDKYKFFNISNKVAFYKYFIDQLLINIKYKNFYKQVSEDVEGYSELFNDLAYLIRESGHMFKG